jgi:hypothetical protein
LENLKWRDINGSIILNLIWKIRCEGVNWVHLAQGLAVVVVVVVVVNTAVL